jgi:hypothetical protein
LFIRFFTSALAGAAAPASVAREVGVDRKSLSRRGHHVVDLYRLYVIEEFFLYDECKAFTIKNLIIFFWLIQSQTELWTASPAACEQNPDFGA